MKAIVVPQDLLGAPYYQNYISIDSANIIEACTHTRDKRGAMFLKDHMLLFVLEGANVITHGQQTYKVNKNEMVLLKKNISFEYHKTGDAKSNHYYDSLMFCIKEEFLVEFMKMANIKDTHTVEPATINVKPVKEPLRSFLISIKPYFNNPENIDKGLVRLKMMELLYDLVSTDKNLLLQLIQLKRQVVTDITQVIDENYINPLNLADFAYLSGRSLSSFKRDFNAIYNCSPAQFIKEKRLNKAKELLILTNWQINEVCYASGFENVAHFTRVYKTYFGETPSATREDLEKNSHQ